MALWFASFVVGHRIWIRSDGFVAGFLNGGGVADLGQAFILQDADGGVPVSNISANTFCAAEVLMVLASTSSSRASSSRQCLWRAPAAAAD